MVNLNMAAAAGGNQQNCMIPDLTPEEREIMDNDQNYPLSPQERRFERKVKNFRKQLPEMLVSPFNYDNWSQV